MYLIDFEIFVNLGNIVIVIIIKDRVIVDFYFLIVIDLYKVVKFEIFEIKRNEFF